jgi:outer membrane lipoprotein-sorting protein
MRYVLTVLLWPALLPGVRAQENDAEKLFRDMEKRITAATALRVTFDFELRAIKGRAKESKLGSEVSKGTGSLLLTKDNRVRLKTRGDFPEFRGLDLVSDGKHRKLAIYDDYRIGTLGDAKAEPTPDHLYRLLSTQLYHLGLELPTLQMAWLLKYHGAGVEKVEPSDFKAGATEKVGGRDARVVRYEWEGLAVTVWIDPKTLLPRKRVVVWEKENLHITETYTEFTLDPRIDARAFELPVRDRAAERLFRAMAEKINAARAVQVTFDFETKEKKLTPFVVLTPYPVLVPVPIEIEEAKFKGSLLFTNDNKARLKMSGTQKGKKLTVELISDGKQMKSALSRDTLARLKPARTPRNLHEQLTMMASRAGLRGFLFPLLMTEFGTNPEIQFTVASFRMGTTEKVGDRTAKVITYQATMGPEPTTVTLWIDTETLLPLRRLIGSRRELSRTTERCHFNLSPKIDVGTFQLDADGADPTPDPTLVVPRGYGTVRGKVTYDGDPPDPGDIRLRQDFQANGNRDHFLKGDTKGQTWKVGRDKAVANVVVWLAPPKGKHFPMPPRELKTWKDVVLDQPFGAFEPHVFVLFPTAFNGVPSGQVFEVRNSSPITRNTKWSGGPDNPGDNRILPPGKSLKVELVPSGLNPVVFQSGIDKWMSAYAWVFDHPYAGVTDRDGNYEIRNVPAGVDLRVVAWHQGANQNPPRPRDRNFVLPARAGSRDGTDLGQLRNQETKVVDFKIKQ